MRMCDKCNNKPANVHIRRKVNGVLSESYLCQDCAAKQGSPLLSFVNIDNYISNLMRAQEPKKKQDIPVCPHCGYDIDMIQKTGRVGCARCYDHYDELLSPVIKKIHGGRIHSTELTKKEDNGEDKQVKELKRQLRAAIEKEEYEMAAVLRDKIRDLSEGEQQ